LRRIHAFWIIVIFIVLFIAIVSGYRFTAESAAEAHSFLPKHSQLVTKHNTGFGQVFIYSVEDYYMTIVPKKVGLLWIANASISTKSINDKNDKVRTIGVCSFTGDERAGTIMVVDVMDDRVAYIEAGEETERIRKKVTQGEYVEFVWDKSYFPHQIDPIALTESGEKLYVYDYGKYTNFTDQKELRWHEAE
jgi:hypothetical protein